LVESGINVLHEIGNKDSIFISICIIIIFYEMFDNNMETYNDIMTTIRCDYNEIIGKLANESCIPEIRQLIHKLVGVVLILEGKNYEIVYYLKMLLNIDKKETKLEYYQIYMKMIMDYDESFLGL